MKLYYYLALISLLSCSNAQVKIDTIPEGATVSSIGPKGEIKEIGKTPLNIKEDQLYVMNSGFAQLKITKDQFLDDNVVITKPVMSRDLQLSFKLKKLEQSSDARLIKEDNEKIATSIARLNALIKEKQLSEAENVLMVFIQQYPHISVGYDYLGNVYYLQKNINKALSYYQRAQDINPQNMERKTIINKLQEMNTKE